MNVSSFTTNTILRDPNLIKNLNQTQFRENLHKGFLQFTFLIKRVYGPFTPEPESESEEDEPPPKPKPKRPSKVWVSKTKRASQVAKEQNWKSMLTKYKSGATSKTKLEKPKPKKTPRKPKGAVTLPRIKKSKGDDEGYGPGADKQRVRYTFRYSQSLDLYKQQKYEALLREMGVDPNCADITKITFTDIDDPELLEVSLDWCRIGTFVEDNYRPVASYQTQYDDVTEADRFSVLFGQSRAPSRKSIVSLVSERSNLGLDTPVRMSMGNTPRLPPIGERRKYDG